MQLDDSRFLRRLLATLWLTTLMALSACANGTMQGTASAQPYHAFSFDGWFDKWATQVDLLEYSYGDQYRMVRNSVTDPRSAVFKGMDSLPPTTEVNGPMPVGEFLYVKWRIKETGEVLEDKVDLRNRLPANMFEHKLTFVIDGKQLYVYLVTPKPKHKTEPPILKTYLSKYTVTYEIYPHNTYKP